MPQSTTARRHLLPTVKPPKRFLINSDPDRLYPMIAPPGSPPALGWYGKEQIVAYRDGILVVQNDTFRRYLFGLSCVAEMGNGEIVLINPALSPYATAALDIRRETRHYHRNLVERIYVLPELRRRGIATALVQAARQDLPNLALDGHLSDDGAAFFGYVFKH